MSLEAEVYSIDANVIIRFLTGDDPRLARKAAEILRGVESGETMVLCDPVNLAETVWVLKSFYRLTNQRIRELLEPILVVHNFLVPDKEHYLLALRLFAGGMKSFGDACACAAALRDCDGRLYSFDVKLSSVPGISRSESIPTKTSD